MFRFTFRNEARLDFLKSNGLWRRRSVCSGERVFAGINIRFNYPSMGEKKKFLFVSMDSQDFVSLVGGVIGAIHIPEKWFPGHFDLCFNSHNIMHVLVVLAVYYMHQATIADLIWMASVECGQIPEGHYMEVR